MFSSSFSYFKLEGSIYLFCPASRGGCPRPQLLFILGLGVDKLSADCISSIYSVPRLEIYLCSCDRIHMAIILLRTCPGRAFSASSVLEPPPKTSTLITKTKDLKLSALYAKNQKNRKIKKIQNFARLLFQLIYPSIVVIFQQFCQF